MLEWKMTKDKLTYDFPYEINEEEIAYIQRFISECFEDGAIDDCQCPHINVRVLGLTPLRSHFSVQFACNCGQTRPVILNKLID
jgi:hypothetical protein